MARKPIDSSTPSLPVPKLPQTGGHTSGVPGTSRSRTLSADQKMALVDNGVELAKAGLVVAKTIADTARIRAEGEVAVATIRAQTDAIRADSERIIGQITAEGDASLKRSQGLAEIAKVALSSTSPEHSLQALEKAIDAWKWREQQGTEISRQDSIGHDRYSDEDPEPRG